MCDYIDEEFVRNMILRLGQANSQQNGQEGRVALLRKQLHDN